MEKEFFEFVQERQNIYIKKEILKQEPPYTDDPIFQKYHFCNVFREQDAGTKVVINLKSDNDLELLANIYLYRQFNRRDHFKRIGWININTYDRQTLRDHIVAVKETGPIFRGAYMTSWTFSYILDGLEYIINNNFNLKDCNSPEEVYKKLQKIKCVGPFLAYQIFLDLSYFGERFHKWDGNDFVKIGPGSKPPVAEMLGIDLKDLSDQQCEDYMVYLRDIQDKYLTIDKRLDLSDIEMTLCEVRKYNNFKNNTGRKRLFKQ